jgi:DNA-binding HxlR family transcriptional regulator/putative sterol carrier protein
MSSRSYNQLCGLAYALDKIGERWTMLMIRELIPGPRRFTDLLNGLPGISTNLLTERLKQLEGKGIIWRHTLPPPAASTVYELTALGRSLEQAMLELGKWGSQFVPPSLETAAMLHLGSYALTPKTFFRPALAQGINETYALHIDGEVQQIRIAEGEISIQQGEPPKADAVFTTEMPIYLGLLTGQINPDEAVAVGLVQVEGDRTALRRFVRICGMLDL